MNYEVDGVDGSYVSQEARIYSIATTYCTTPNERNELCYVNRLRVA